MADERMRALIQEDARARALVPEPEESRQRNAQRWLEAKMVESPLSPKMEFDHVIEVLADGSVTDALFIGPLLPGVVRPVLFYAPDLQDDDLSDDAWTLMNGYSGQYGYSGPVMHPSEFIGGGLERDILAQPGYYVVIAAYYTPEDENDDDIGGWAIAYRPQEDSA